ncbi:MAG: tRNA pseudouridine(38-40) synthase TruA [Candidatus Omnitrophica bacterium]|nr:tRNA pseudouridine(38-40) synthase TruA [Candidatus Omnitrophota bacterium]
MRNIKLTIAYDGTAYKGWQVQKNGRTVQGELQKAVKKVFGAGHCVHGAGRTDAGVHAIAQVANFKTSGKIHVENIKAALNALLPVDIAVKDAEEVPAGFHSRFTPSRKYYRYDILNQQDRDPFCEKYSWRVPYKLNTSLMKREASCLQGRHDFKSFQASDKRQRSSVRRIFNIRVTSRKPHLSVDIEGEGFLYNMVRNIVGTLVDIGRGYLPPGSMKKILKAKKRSEAGPTAPAKGLFLVKIVYD